MPSMTESAPLEVFAVGPNPLRRRTLEVAPAEPPSNDLEIPAPPVEIAEVAVIPRPFRADEAEAR